MSSPARQPLPETASRLAALHRGALPLAANPVNGAIMLGLTWGTLPPAVMLGWFGLLCLIIALRFVERSAFRARRDPSDQQRWFYFHAAGSTATGLMWGATGALIVLTDDPALHMIVGLVAAGMVAGAAVSSFASTLSFAGMTVACLAPITGAFLVHGGGPYVAMALFTIMYAIVMTMTAQSLATAVFASARLEARLRDSIESLSDGYIVYDREGRVLVWNKHMVELFPYLRGKIAAGMTVRDVFVLGAEWSARGLPEHERAAWIDRHVENARQPNRTSVIELPGGMIVELTGRRTAEGGWVTIYRDVTAQRRAEAEMKRAQLEAEQASRAKSRFLANMSHEIRTPLSGVVSLLDGMLEDPLSDSQRRRAETARRSADQLMEIIGDILDMSKLEAGAVQLEETAIRLTEIVDDALHTVAAKAEAKGLTLRQDIAPAAQGWFMGDSTRLRQILINLAGNAVKFTERGSVTIAVKPAPGGIEFAVSDTGIGIAADQLRHLFTKFTQADESISRRFGGTGLGLALVREFATLMGGTADVSSTPGKGSTFMVTVPLPPAEPPLHPAETAPALAPALSGMPLQGRRILLVEDDVTNRFAAGELLRRCGAEVEVAEDGTAGVAKALAAAFDLILMDMQMPQLDGLSATRKLRATPGPNRATPVLALTANAFTDDIEQCLAAGMNAHLTKPLRRAAVLAQLIKFLPPADPAPRQAASA